MKNILCLIVIVAFCSCNNNKPKPQLIAATPTGIQSLQSNLPTAPVNQLKSNLIFNPAHGQPGHRCDLTVGAPLNQVAQAKPNTNTAQAIVPAPTVNTNPVVVNNKGQKLNPKHGEPGHRCDIAIGVPLNSKPNQPAKVISTPLTADQPLEAKNGTKLNPKHGEPGHRCDIAVGTPLT